MGPWGLQAMILNVCPQHLDKLDLGSIIDVFIH